MNTWVTSDMHFGHANIIKYCNRPFSDVDRMNEVLIHNWNQRVKEDDIVYHLGDFCFKGGVEGGISKPQYWENQLNGKIIHIKGNHDRNNHLKSHISCAVLEFAKKRIYAIHNPDQLSTTSLRILGVEFIICGHVHEKWKHMIIDEVGYKKWIVINVGTDRWNFMPAKLEEVVGYYHKVKADLNCKSNSQQQA